MTALVAMSGGVDSSVAAALMKEAGHDVIGVTLRLWSGPNGEAPTAGCCTVSDAEDARRVAAQLDIPYYVFDYTDVFSAGVVDRFVEEYLRGRTPNPCVECNRTVKFSALLAQADELGCDLLVTGHYARVRLEGDTWRLYRGVDRRKDQSYVLSMLGQEQLARVRFPVGELDKSETRRIAARLGLRTASKPESQDICFVGRDDYRRFVRRHAGDRIRPGRIVTVEGDEVGTHQGVVDFTIGQRRGLGVAAGEKRYVVDIDPDAALVTIGRKQDLTVEAIEVGSVTWTSGAPPEDPWVEVQYRAHGEAVPSRIRRTAGGVEVVFTEPQAAVAPGQTATFYRGDEVLGGGIIRTTHRSALEPACG
jgi:tRNA-specific 2-thiouridylase